MSTRDLPDDEFAACVDLGIVNGDHQQMITLLAQRGVAEQPRAWAWSRLLELAEAAGDARCEEFRARFVRWTAKRHPRLIQAGPADDDRALYYGIPREALQRHSARGTPASFRARRSSNWGVLKWGCSACAEDN